MESFQALRRRTTDIFQSIPQSLPASKSAKSTIPTMKGTWEKVNVPPLPRSSHSVDVISGSAYIFGGETGPQQPANNDMHVVNLPLSITASADSYPVKATSPRQYETQEVPTVEISTDVEEVRKEMADVSLEGEEEEVEEGEPLMEGKGKERAFEGPAIGDVPSPRVGHATAVIGTRIFMFGGRGGPDMEPLEEEGRVWVFDTRHHTWSYLDPARAAAGIPAPFPPARSDHCAAAIDRPRDFAHRRDDHRETWTEWVKGDSDKVGIPQAPIVGNVAANAVDEERTGYGTFFVHAGRVAGGDRATELWAFNVRSRVWSELPDAPGPARDGAALCVTKGKLFRFGGFDGTAELGGQIDVLHLASEVFDDAASKGEVAVTSRREWETLTPISGSTSDTLNVNEWPPARSASAMVPLQIHGRDYLVLLMGERAANVHEGTGRCLDDAWVYQVPTAAGGHARTASAVRDAVWGAIGRKGAEGRWTRVLGEPFDDEGDELPVARGWVNASVVEDMDDPAVLVWGGAGEADERLGDGWILRLG